VHYFAIYHFRARYWRFVAIEKNLMKVKGAYIKLILTAVFVGILCCVVDKDKFVAALKAVPLSLILIAAAGYAVTQAISATKWWVLVRSAGIEVSLGYVIQIFFIGMFVNVVGVGTVGGDIVRALMLDKKDKNKGASLATVVADRAIGLSVLASIGLIAGSIFGSLTEEPKLAVLALLVIIAVILGFYYVTEILGYAAKKLPRFARYFNQIATAFPRDKKIFAKVVLLAIVFHLSQISLVAYIIKGLGAEVPISYILFAVPFINLVTTLPISWMGLGLREGAYAFFFAPKYFESSEQALLVGSIWFVAMVIAGGVGGIFSFLKKKDLLPSFNDD
jgi:uncharacterized membrane protein YbhN (UPF0104 family)